MTPPDRLVRARAAFRQESWSEAYDVLATADRQTSLEPEDLERLAKAAYLTGKERECTDFWARAHQAYVKLDDIPRAIYCAFWLGLILSDQGETAQAGGWIARARGLNEDLPVQCAEQGLLLVPEALQCMSQGLLEKAHDLFNRTIEIGRRFSDRNVATLGRLGRGQTLILQGRIADGTTLLDEAMVSVVSDEVSPLVAGIVYCAVVQACRRIYDFRRAHEWTDALAHWCDSHPDLVPYRGECLVRRAEVMMLHGNWKDAIAETKRACEILATLHGSSITSQAYYQQGELFRLQGQFSKATEMYARASKRGMNPQPGLALLRLAQGRLDVAVAAIRQVEKVQRDPIERSRLLPAYVEIMLQADDARAAQKAAEEIDDIASALDAGYLHAVSEYLHGSIEIVRGEPLSALARLRSALKGFNDAGATYESARTRVLMGFACRALGDNDTAAMELGAAREVFERLGALPDLKRIDTLARSRSSDSYHGLTRRELEILRHLATGKTNKEIAADLFISERTVDRHVSNIYVKLDVSSRAAATAYAFSHNLTSS
ncbi:LuxR C-terminal-related transcriptional regulator [Salinispira pacifica]